MINKPNIILSLNVTIYMFAALNFFRYTMNSRKIILGVFGLSLFLLNVQCKEKSSGEQKASAPQLIIDSSYLAKHSLSAETKKALEQLNEPKMVEGNIGDQISSFIREGIYDYGEVFKFIELRWMDNSAELNPKSRTEIDDLSKIMILFPNMKIKMDIYTDNNGNPDKLEKLSQDRFNFIKKEIVSAGVSPDRIVGKGFGSKYPVADNKTMEGQLINNRIEITILKIF
ncbi:MAG: OmpA family protein [Saprospiraceae bacterium]